MNNIFQLIFGSLCFLVLNHSMFLLAALPSDPATCRPAKFIANYFQINSVPDWVLHQYRVDIAPEEDRTGTRRFLLRAHSDRLGGYLFDGTVLYTAERLTTPQNPVITLTSEDPGAGKVFTITIRHVGEVGFGDYAYIQVYNLLLRACIRALDLQLVGRDYYDPNSEINIPRHRVKLWKGFKATIRQHDGGILLCCDISFKVMRSETVYDLLRQCQQRNPQKYRKEFEDEILGCFVLTKYNNKTYRIDNVGWEETPLSTFTWHGEQISLAEYMARKYQITIRDKKQPLLVSRARPRDVRAGMAELIKLIPELCNCTGITDAMRADNSLMRGIADYTKVLPAERIRRLTEFNRSLVTNREAVANLAKFKMSFDTNLVTVDARTVKVEDIIFGDNVKKKADEEKASWNLRDALFNPKDIHNWFVIVPHEEKQAAASFVNTLQRVGSKLRMNIVNPNVCILRSGNTGAEYTEQLNRVLDSVQPQIIMCVVKGTRLDVYAAIKKKCCVDRPVPTQVICAKNIIGQNQMSVATKVATQMCCKLGGAPWSVEIPMAGLMVVGFDVCHVKTPQGPRSFGAMVASLDKPMTRYFSSVTPHPCQYVQELSTNLALNISRAVIRFKEENNGKLPARIVIYRDGVGDGQIKHVFDIELEQVKKALGKIYNGCDVKMAFVIVTKRINTKFFTITHKNPPPGSIVDDVITDPEKYDFYLVSQSVGQGTATPTAYNVIWDTINLPADKLQRLTFKLCHMYYNWNGTVRVPAPCQYAHKLAFLVGKAIGRRPNEQLDNLLYFL